MTYLLDSHVLLWWLADDPQLSAAHRNAILNGHVAVSAVSVAELQIKASLGKLDIPPGLDEVIAGMGFEALPFTTSHAMALRELPFHHRDPFDRMLISQAIVEHLVFLTVDENCRKYDLLVG